MEEALVFYFSNNTQIKSIVQIEAFAIIKSSTVIKSMYLAYEPTIVSSHMIMHPTNLATTSRTGHSVYLFLFVWLIEIFTLSYINSRSIAACCPH